MKTEKEEFQDVGTDLPFPECDDDDDHGDDAGMERMTMQHWMEVMMQLPY
jgi:hypothetical protein